jgi:hypothetical protein
MLSVSFLGPEYNDSSINRFSKSRCPSSMFGSYLALTQMKEEDFFEQVFTIRVVLTERRNL